MKYILGFIIVLLTTVSACKSHQKTGVTSREHKKTVYTKKHKTKVTKAKVTYKNHKLTKQPTFQKLEREYKKYKGVKYVYGGTTSLGFDCSGFVQRVYKNAFNINLPRTTKYMMKTGKKVSKSKLKIGDLVFFHPTRRYYHVGIYMGNGIFMHASSSRGISKSKLDLKYWVKSYVTARRIL